MIPDGVEREREGCAEDVMFREWNYEKEMKQQRQRQKKKKKKKEGRKEGEGRMHSINSHHGC